MSAVASVAVATSIAAPASPALADAHPDAELIALWREFEPVGAELDWLEFDVDEIPLKISEKIAKPDALRVREDDRLIWRTQGGEYQRLPADYYTSQWIERLRYFDPNDWDETQQARFVELFTVGRAWLRECRQALQAVSYDQMKARVEELRERAAPLQRAILAAEALTLDGIIVKARLARWCNGSYAEELDLSGPVNNISVEHSLIVNLLTLGENNFRNAPGLAPIQA